MGNLFMGGNHPVVIQSMTNTDTLHTEATVEQSQRLFDLGCRLVRITAPGLKEAHNLENIKSRLVQKGYTDPLCADIHFLPEAAAVAAQIVEKVRINPGNYCDRKTGKTEFSPVEQQAERQRIGQRIAPLLEICRQHGTAIRIGVNQGSLSERMVSLYGNTPLAMVVIGGQMAGADLGMVFRDKKLYLASATKLLAAPLLAAAVLLPFRLDWTVFTAMVILTGCPTAGICSLFAQSMGKDTAMAARQVTLSTLLCIATLPPVAVLAQTLAGK